MIVRFISDGEILMRPVLDTNARQRGRSSLDKAVVSLRPYWIGAVLFSIAINILMLVSPLYMLQIYDRVMTSGSRDTLSFLTILAVGLLLIFAAADGGRRRIFSLIACKISDQLSDDIFRAKRPAPGSGQAAEKAVSELSSIQAFLVNGRIQPLFDAPFAPFFIAVTFIIHPTLGWFGLGSTVILLGLAVWTEKTSRTGLEEAQKKERRSARFLSGISHHFSSILTMGMAARVQLRWDELRRGGADETLAVTNKTAYLSAWTKALRQVMQVGILGLGAYLALQQKISPGAIVAASIIMGRALAPIDQSVAIWPALVKVRQAYADLSAYLTDAPEVANATPLPRPEAQLVIDTLGVSIPGNDAMIVPPFSAKMSGGSVLLILGQSGCGKSSLLQTLSGAWAPRTGQISLGGRALHDWDSDDRGQYIGYLSQRVELLPGTICENIARFSAGPEELVFKAAKKAGCHEMILSLPDGYDTFLDGSNASALSAGQMQSIGIARALYGDPVCVFLDEPTANLDPRGVSHVITLVRQLKHKGAIAMIATHDYRLIHACDTVLTIQDGSVRFNTRDECLKMLTDSAKAHQAQQANSQERQAV